MNRIFNSKFLRIVLFTTIYNSIFFFINGIGLSNDINYDQQINVIDAISALQISSGIKNGVYIKKNLSWEGNWKENIEYNVNEMVFYEGSSFICILKHVSNSKTTPLENPGIWDLVAKGSMKFDNETDPSVPDNLKDGISWEEILYDKIGIGTQSPKSILHVIGDVNIDGKLLVNGSLNIPFFILDGNRKNEYSPRHLEWTPGFRSNKYEIYRNNELLETVNSDTLSFTDNDLKLTGSISYYVKGRVEKSNSIRTFYKTNAIEFLDTKQPAFGDGRDGVFTGGLIDRSKNYFFKSVQMKNGSAMNFVGEGNGVIKIMGNFEILAGSQIILRQSINLNCGTITFNSITKNLSVDRLNYGNSGKGGSSCSSAGDASGCGGNGGAIENGNIGGYARNHNIYYKSGSGEGGIYPGGNGKDGSSCSEDGDSRFAGGGGGGAAGKHGESVEKIAFIVGGNTLIEGTIIGKGSDGGKGGSGGRGYVASNAQFGHSGAGGGGAGGAGGHGGHVYIFCKGSYNANNVQLNLQGGKGGKGGVGGIGGCDNGTDGSKGGDGNNGILEYINIQ